jgi:alpha,alpha-trehalose phosphorylase
VWSALVYGFGGLRDTGGRYTLDPRLPEAWTSLTYRITLQGARVRVCVDADQVVLTLETGEQAELSVRGKPVQLTTEAPTTVPLDGHGPRLPGGPPVWGRDGVRRADGTVITASVPRATETHPSELTLRLPYRSGGR